MSLECWEKANSAPQLPAEAPSVLTDWIADPWVSCDLDDHSFGERHAMPDDLDRHDALWGRLTSEEMTLVRAAYRKSSAVGPNPEASRLMPGGEPPRYSQWRTAYRDPAVPAARLTDVTPQDLRASHGTWSPTATA